MNDEMLEQPPAQAAQNPGEVSVNAGKLQLATIRHTFQQNFFLVIQNSDDHMEYSILASLTSTLIGFVIMDNPSNEAAVQKLLRNGRFNEMIATLDMYYEFLGMAVTVSISIYSSLLAKKTHTIPELIFQAEASQQQQLRTMKNVIDYFKKLDEN